MISIDGAEGGGQMLRTALSLSALTGKAFRIKNIRARRNDPGLKPQHLACIRAVSEVCNGYAEGAEENSADLLFVPRKLAVKNVEVDIGTAGSVTLLLQALLLPCMFGHKSHTLTITGGTDTAWSMPIDYFANVVVPQLSRVCGLEVKVLKRGYYPAGGGKVQVVVKPQFSLKKTGSFEGLLEKLKEKSLLLTKQGTLMRIKGVSHASKDLMEARVAERTAAAAKQELINCNVPIDCSFEYANTESTGSGITLWAIYSLKDGDIDSQNPVRVGADALGEAGKKSEVVGKEAAQSLRKEMIAPVDSHLADNLIPLLALCGTEMEVSKMSSHALTNIQVAKAFLGDCLEVKGKRIMKVSQV
ncbi:RNA 3'-terminal phosphate cyclase [Candidatus Woesearchaeota archaeon]|nr:RNA 3'-terminal phosphate cyclase [Candidatus Woesearchaeota archaeon]